MKKVIIITTGGTMGSALQLDSIAVDLSQQHLSAIIERVKNQLGCEIEIFSPLNKNSEAFCPQDWLILLDALQQADSYDVAGIVVIHGSDTMVYSIASVLAYQRHWRKKICFTGSYYPPTHHCSDAVLNLTAALSFVIDSTPSQGIYLAFRANAINSYANIIQGAYLKPMSFDGLIFEATYQHIVSTYHPNRGLTHMNALNSVRFPCLDTNRLPDHHAMIRAQNKIAYLSLYPGMDKRLLESVIEKRQLIIIGMYHSGTASIDLIEFIQDHAQEVTFLMGTFPRKYIQIPYDSTKQLKHAGAHLYADLQPYYIYVFSLLALGLGYSTDDILHQFSVWSL